MYKHTEVRDIIEREYSHLMFKAQKDAYVLARRGIVGEVLEVRCSDGLLETVQTVKEDQIVIWNCDSADEKYAVDREQFESRYDYSGRYNLTWDSYKSKGVINGIIATEEILDRL